jgi:hypothetical protein
VHIITSKGGANKTSVRNIIEAFAKNCDFISDTLTLSYQLIVSPQGEGSGSCGPQPPPKEVTTGQKKKRSQRRRQKRRQQKIKDVGNEGQEGPETRQKGGSSKGQQALQKVFVNVFTDQNIDIPSIVYRTLNLGANYQLSLIPSISQIWKDWAKTRKFLEEKANWEFEERKTKGTLDRCSLSSFNNIVAAVNDRRIFNSKYINKKLQSDKALRTAANVNNAMRTVFNFLSENNLFVILADKNLGLTIFICCICILSINTASSSFGYFRHTIKMIIYLEFFSLASSI